MRGRIVYGARPLDLVEEYTAFAGRMPPLPAWINGGAVVGLQGGTDAVTRKLDPILAHGAPVSAVWLQDWVGKRTTIVGSQLWWNWMLNEEQYPGWEGMVRDLDGRGIRVMTYVNPFLVDIRGQGTPFARNLFAEEAAAGYLVRAADGSPYLVTNTDFDAGIKETVSVYLPAGEWVHAWSGAVMGSPSRGKRQTIDAPLGKPAVLYRKGSAAGATFVANLASAGLL